MIINPIQLQSLVNHVRNLEYIITFSNNKYSIFDPLTPNDGLNIVNADMYTLQPVLEAIILVYNM